MSAVHRTGASSSARSKKNSVAEGGDIQSNRAASRRRLEILAVASRLFADRGFEATSIRQIANELGMVPASLYHHFATKEEMLHEIIEEPTRSLQKRFFDIARRPAPPDQRLAALSEAWFEAWLDDWEAHAITTNQSHNFVLKDDFQYVRDCMIENYAALENVLEQGIATGTFRKDLNVFYTITAISAIVNAGARSIREGTLYTIKPPPHLTRAEIIKINDELVLRLVCN